MRNNATKTFRPDIEGLRGIAVFVVVAFHCGIPGFSGGSSASTSSSSSRVISSPRLLLQELETTSTIGLLNFYARRIRRLLPASALMLLLTLAVGAVVLAPQELEFAARAARATAVYLGNVFFAQQARDYFRRRCPDESAPAHVVARRGGTVLSVLAAADDADVAAGEITRDARRDFLAAHCPVTDRVRMADGAQPHGRLLRLVYARVGVWSGRSCESAAARTTRRSPLFWRLAGWSGLIAIALSSMLLTPAAAFPGWIATLPVVGTAIALMAGRELPGQGFARLLDTRPFQYVGELSYSWYLWHWPFLVLALALLPNLAVAGKAVAALLAFAAAALTHIYVENPIRFQPCLVARRGATLALGAALALVSIAAAFLALHLAHGWRSIRRLRRLPARRAISQACRVKIASALEIQRWLKPVSSAARAFRNQHRTVR